MSSPTPRFTLACLRQVGIDPCAHESLDDVSHPLLEQAKLQWSADERPLHRIVEIDDQVLLKIKPNTQDRGAVWVDIEDADRPWLVAAGLRREGDASDFYRQLVDDCKRRRAQMNQKGLSLEPGKKAYSKHLRPTEADQDRLLVDGLILHVREARARIGQMVGMARRSPGKVFTCSALGAECECIVYRNDLDELYVSISIRASTLIDVHATILSIAVPDADADDWEPLTPSEVPALSDGDIVYFTLLTVPRLGS